MAFSDYRGRQDLDRAIRDNDPGDLDYTPSFQGCTSSDGRFCIFIDMPHGIRAFYKVMHTYRTQDGCDTLRKIIMRYAPPNENNSAAYMAGVSNGTGIGLDDALPTDSASWQRIAQYFFNEEAGGEASKYVTDADYAEGLRLFNESEPGYFC